MIRHFKEVYLNNSLSRLLFSIDVLNSNKSMSICVDLTLRDVQIQFLIPFRFFQSRLASSIVSIHISRNKII